jgi:tRNA (guanine37-N1)-methyltransferase
VDRDDPRFATEVEVLAVRAPRSAVGGLMAKLRRHTLDRPRLNRVQHLDDDRSLVLLDTESCPVDGNTPMRSRPTSSKP